MFYCFLRNEWFIQKDTIRNFFSTLRNKVFLFLWFFVCLRWETSFIRTYLSYITNHNYTTYDIWVWGWGVGVGVYSCIQLKSYTPNIIINLRLQYISIINKRIYFTERINTGIHLNLLSTWLSGDVSWYGEGFNLRIN